MKNAKANYEKIKKLEKRLANLEKLSGTYSENESKKGGGRSKDFRVCSLPNIPPRKFDENVSTDRARSIISLGDYWVNQTNLRYYMFDSGPFGGAANQREVVRRAFQVWKDIGIGVNFTEVDSVDDAELRIGFLRNDGSWSYVGKVALLIGQNERTMNFGWNIAVSGPNGLDTAIHEIGHALGFKHEHQNPNAGIVWDRDAVYDYFERTQNPPWDKDTTDRNILNKIDPTTVGGTEWDPDSVMHYSFAAGLIREPSRFRAGLEPAAGLSEKDTETALRFYPPVDDDADVPELKLFHSECLSLDAGEQKDFRFQPKSSRRYHFSTFGQSDTVVVLFEETDDGFVYVAGDDDSGLQRNASLHVRLVKGRKYQLRVRLFYQAAQGDTALMVW